MIREILYYEYDEEGYYTLYCAFQDNEEEIGHIVCHGMDSFCFVTFDGISQDCCDVAGTLMDVFEKEEDWVWIIENLKVSKDYQKQGYGKKLIEMALNFFKSKNPCTVGLALPKKANSGYYSPKDKLRKLYSKYNFQTYTSNPDCMVLKITEEDMI